MRRIVNVAAVSLSFAAVMGNASAPIEQRAKWQAPPSVKKMRNPVSTNRQVLDEARKLYQKNCLTCHGAEGRGDGPAIEFIEPRPPDITASEIALEMREGEIFWKITEGRNPMPSFKKKLSENERWKLVHYVRRLGTYQPN